MCSPFDITGRGKRHFHSTGCCSSPVQSLYEILGIQKDASPEEIRKAFHEQAKKYHPDKSKNSSEAKRRFRDIREAYEILRNPHTRAKYDQTLEVADNGARFDWEFEDSKEAENFVYGTKGFGRRYEDPFSSSFKRIFSEVFHDATEPFAKDIEIELALSFSEAAKGCTKRVAFTADIPCSSCVGSGHPTNVVPQVCTVCRGSGKVAIPPFVSVCSTCKGKGHVFKEFCSACRGFGVVQGVKNIKVTIPAGVDAGDTINVPDAGNYGGCDVHSGNLYIRIKIAQDPIFCRDGADIYVDLPISFTQAILGGKVIVPSLSGDLPINIPKGVQHGQIIVLRGRGLVKPGSLAYYGDQYVRFRVQFPVSVNDHQRILLEEFAKEELINESMSNENWLALRISTG